MESRFALAGHPLHPALVPVPIGLVAWTIAADLIFLATGEPTWYDVAFFSGLGTLVTGLLAAAFGVVDYLAIASRTDARGVATAHLLLGAAVLAMFAFGAALMLDRAAIVDFAPVAAVHLLAGAGLAASAWLGGELVFRHHVALVADDAGHARDEAARHAFDGERAASA